jgi:UDP-N-acetylglucosamine 1-carboxyvinyltransferase
VGPLLHRYGRASVPLVGGDAIGARPIDFHMEALRKLGASVTLEGGVWRAEAKRLHGALIDLPYPSVGATESVLLSSVLAEGTTVIKNAAVEPEIIDLILLLQKMGALITVEVDRSIVVEGVPRLRGVQHRIIADRIEVASFAAAAVATDGDVLIEGAEQTTLMTFLNALRRVGGEFEVTPQGVRFFRGSGDLRSTTIETGRAPGIRDGLATALRRASHADARAVRRARDRARAALRLHRGAARDGRERSRCTRRASAAARAAIATATIAHSVLVQGPTPLRGTTMQIPDLRAGFSYLLAACVASGPSGDRRRALRRARLFATSPARSRSSAARSPFSRNPSRARHGAELRRRG